MFHKSRKYRRAMRYKHIARKKRLINSYIDHPVIPNPNGKGYITDFSREIPQEWYRVDGMYDKGKIHCGCPLCKPGKGFYPSDKHRFENELSRLDVKECIDDYFNETTSERDESYKIDTKI